MKPPQLISAVIFILGLGIGLPVLGNLALPQWLPAWQNVPFHTAIEFYGTFIALLLAWLLLRLRQRGEAAPDYYWMACGFIGMGLLDGMHALTLPGEAFVWFHVVATLVGGLGFALMGRPEPPRRAAKALPGVIAGVVLAVELLAFLVPDSVPSMLAGGRLTLLARSLNAIGGVLFLVAAVRFAVLYREIRGWDEFWFAIHAALFGSAGVLFAGSELWDPAWWWWHFLRFTAYSIALRFVLLTYRRLGERLTEAKWAEEALHEREVGLQYLAYHDTLTGLPNRALLLDRLERALAQAERYNS
jgi:hypothetical protein